jgi:hypothetical protein
MEQMEHEFTFVPKHQKNAPILRSRIDLREWHTARRVPPVPREPPQCLHCQLNRLVGLINTNRRSCRFANHLRASL